MNISPESRLGPYVITAPLGKGGMGEVWRARDTRLDRDVAIKVLTESMARDPERVLRFEREAKLLASLNHSNIAHVYGFETADLGRDSPAERMRFLVLEFVEGETLAARLKRGALPVDETLDVCKKIAEAVDAAHEKGVIHRDLKPGNVMLTPDGNVKVLDFGLAKALVDDPTGSTLADSPTITATHTRPGVVLGTAAYMSPEQARGKTVDKRTDIWSFGVLLYESLSGRRPFAGDTTSDLVAQILEREPDWSALPAATPPLIRWLLLRCLAKDVRRRLRDIGDAGLDIETALNDPAGRSSQFPGIASVSRRPVGRFVAATLAVGLLIGAMSMWLAQQDSPRAVRRLEISADRSSGIEYASISPDGTHMAMVMGNNLWIRDLSSFDARMVAGTKNATTPFWSPDGQWIGFMQQNRIHKAALSGGGVVTLCKFESDFTSVGGGAWTDDGRILFTTGNSDLFEVSASGGEPRVWLRADAEDDVDFHDVTVIPGGRGAVFCVHPRNSGWYIGASDGSRRVVVCRMKGTSLTSPSYSSSGHVLFNRSGENGGLWAVAFDADRLSVLGDPFLVDPQGAQATVSRTGDLAYVRFGGGRGFQLAWLDLEGNIEPVGEAHALLLFPELSPDGRRVALSGYSEDELDVWIHDLQDGQRRRLTNEPGRELVAGWSPDGTRICVVDTTLEVTRMVSVEDGVQIGEAIDGGVWNLNSDWSACAVVRQSETTGLDIWAVWPAGQREAVPVVQTDAYEGSPQISPDGQWMAYESDLTGVFEIYLTRFPGGEGRRQVSAGGGQMPIWAPGGDVLYYSAGETDLMAVDITNQPDMRFGAAREVKSLAELGVEASMGRCFSTDGKRMLVVRDASAAEGQGSIVLVENWFDELDAGVAGH